METKPDMRVMHSVLLVHEQGHRPPLASDDVASIVYRFVPDSRQDGFAAWESSVEPALTLVDVADRCRDCAGGFRQQALNRLVARELVRVRPKLLVVSGLWGCTVDLPRIADLMGVPTVLLPTQWLRCADGYSEEVQAWLVDAIARSRYVSDEVRDLPGDLQLDRLRPGSIVPRADIDTAIQEMSGGPPPSYTFTYSIYEFLSRDHPLLAAMQEPDVRHFEGKGRVLDLACGAGIFLDLLRQRGVHAVGVERDAVVAEYGRGMGLDIRTQDALEYLQTTEDTFAGIYCSHFVEHVPIEVLEMLLQCLFQRIAPGGVLVMTFPDPESIRSQLLGFWRDPEHVRFYHPELVTSLATALGFVLDWSSYDEQPHEVIPFTAVPEPIPSLSPMELPEQPSCTPGLFESLAMRLGWQPVRRAQQAQEEMAGWARAVAERLQEHELYLEQLRSRTDTLWKLNQTWAWNDNVTLRFRRP